MTSYPMYDPTSIVASGSDLVARSITVLSGSTVNTITPLPRGTVLGRISASDKYIPSVSTASDGSQTPVGVLADTVDPSAGDIVCDAYFEGEFADLKLTFDAGWTATTLEAAFRKANAPIFTRALNTLG
jgi:hypothetical protein